MRDKPFMLLLLPLIPALGFGIVEVARHIAVPGSTTMTPVAVAPLTIVPVTIAPTVAPTRAPPPCIECTAVF